MRTEELYREEIKQDFVKELSRNPDLIYNFFGHLLEDLIERKKTELKSDLKKIYKNIKNYRCRDTGERVDDPTTIYYYFDIKRINKMDLNQLQSCYDKIIQDLIRL